MKKYYAGREPKYARNAPEFWTPEEEEAAIRKAYAEHRAARVEQQARRFHEANKALPAAAAKAAAAVGKASGLVLISAGICIGTAYAVYWTALQAWLWLSAQTWVKPVLAIAVVSAGVAGAVQYSRDSIKRTEKDRGQNPGQNPGHTAGTGQTIIIYQNQDRT